ncbi:PREDICTED: protamine-like protein [Cyprinodon variegatus]|uniref:protamine-like protein n=1 Tax=Cyprinodon variegatus TaxID=28743 RepID=UPI0007425DBF|nr:PREDICTED: protamine-like protein [Cyprinodon variegatus]
MSSPVIALPAASSAKKKARSKKKSGPSVSDLILKIVSGSSQRGGVSLAAVKKALKAGGYDVVKNKARIAVAIKRLVSKKVLLRTKGSFKLNKKPPKPRKRKVVKKKKPKTKKKTAKKTTKKAVKKSPKKKRKAKSPKKAKKPAVAKKAKKPKSPKKAKRAKAKRTKTAAKK